MKYYGCCEILLLCNVSCLHTGQSEERNSKVYTHNKMRRVLGMFIHIQDKNEECVSNVTHKQDKTRRVLVMFIHIQDKMRSVLVMLHTNRTK